MRKIITTTFVTLDGVLQAPGGPEEDTSNGFKWGGWVFPYWDDMMGKIMDGFMNVPFDLLLGRRTYEIFAAYWPHSTEEPIAGKFNSTRKYVASRKGVELTWANSTLVSDEAAIRALKEQDGNDLWVHGSGALIQSLLAENLIDTMYVWTFPVTIGQGKRLFADGTQPAELKLLDQQTSTTGVVISKFEPHGKLKTGSFAEAEPTETESERRKSVM